MKLAAIKKERSLETLNQDIHLRLEYEQANPRLYNFKGKLIIGIEEIPLNNDNIILRGCTLKNTNFIRGIVVYTGHNTKIMLNNIK